MATITMTAGLTALGAWPGDLLRGFAGPGGTTGGTTGGTVVVGRGATSLTLRHGADTPFEGYRVVARGAGFEFLEGEAVAGTVGSVAVLDARGQAVVTFAGLAGPVADDLGQLWADVFGSGVPGAGPGPDGRAAWSHLMAGDDTVVGTAGDDWRLLVGTDAGDDTYLMSAGDDRMGGGLGDDAYHGGAGQDRLTYAETHGAEGIGARRGATVDVGAGTAADPWGGADRFDGVEEFQGSRFADTFLGGAGADTFGGMRGRDVVSGGAATFGEGGEEGADRGDVAAYDDDHWFGGRFGIVARLEVAVEGGRVRGTIRDGFGTTDAVSDVEGVVGTRYGDSLTGSRVGNTFWGGEGRDTFAGGGGVDELRFDRGLAGEVAHGAVVDLGAAKGQVADDGFGHREAATGFEDVVGTEHGDVLRGSGEANRITGGRGADTMTGRGGSDAFVWREQWELGLGDRVTDFAASGPQADVLAFEVEGFDGMTGVLRLVNGTAATTREGTFIFNAATDLLVWDANGSLAGGQSVVAQLTGVAALSAANFELIV